MSMKDLYNKLVKDGKIRTDNYDPYETAIFEKSGYSYKEFMENNDEIELTDEEIYNLIKRECETMTADFIIIDTDKTIYRLNTDLHDEVLRNSIMAANTMSFLRKHKNNIQLLAYIKDVLDRNDGDRWNNYVLIDKNKNALIVPRCNYTEYMYDKLPKLEHKNYNQLDKSVRYFVKGELEI